MCTKCAVHINIISSLLVLAICCRAAGDYIPENTFHSYMMGNMDSSVALSVEPQQRRSLQHFYDGDETAARNFIETGGKVEIILFYGRRRYTKVQLPYLLQNKRHKQTGFLKENMVSVVNVILNTNNSADIKYINHVVSRDPEYFKLHTDFYGKSYCHFYQPFNETKTLYVKVDDDIVYIDNKAIFRMATMKLTTKFMFISANIINHAAVSAHHLQSAVFDYDVIRKAVRTEVFDLGNEDAKLTPLPPFIFEGDAWGDHSWKSGAHGLLQHLMFFHYKRVNDEGIYDTGEKDMDKNRYYRWSINFFMFSPADMVKFKPLKCGSNDELYLSMFLPHDMGKHSGLCGGAVVVHFAYTPQRAFLDQNTTVLRRYHELSQGIREQYGTRFEQTDERRQNKITK